MKGLFSAANLAVSPAARLEPGRIEIADALRGMASVAVALFHFTNGNPTFMHEGWMHWLGGFGAYGVDVFFVISGFVIPLSMRRAGYRLNHFGSFVARRVVRLDPPYLVSVAIVLILGYLSSLAPAFAGKPLAIEWPRLLLHIGYLNDLFGVPWYNVVYWTLALELQFYLIIGVLFPLISSAKAHRSGLTLAILAASGLIIRNPALLPLWISPFLLGILVFRFRSGLMPMRQFFLQTIAVSVIGYFQLGPVALAAALLAWCALSFLSLNIPRWLKFLGAISYSLYLLHVPLGGRVINIASRFALTDVGRLLAICAALVVSITGAYALRRLVEVPAQKWSRSIRLHQRNL